MGGFLFLFFIKKKKKFKIKEGRRKVWGAEEEIKGFPTFLCGPFRGPCHLFDQFLIFCNYLCTVVVCVGSVVAKAISNI
jgi:hypothetical protein